MKLSKSHKIVLTLLMLYCYQPIFCIETVQEPQELREFDDDFKTRYSGRNFNYEGDAIVTQSETGSGNYEDYDENYKDNQKEQNDKSYWSGNLSGFNWVFYLALILAVVFLGYILVNEGGSNLFTSRNKKKIVSHEAITADNIENTDINALINNAENDHNFRLAIRYHYLLVLKQLSIKNHIKFEDDKTNSEYLNEIANKPFIEKFTYISYLYNYIWYGEFPVNFAQYNKAKANFVTLLNDVK